MQLTEIQYNAIMQAINNAKAAIIDDEFIDPYAESPDGYNNASLMKALHEIEDKIIHANIPT